MMRIAFRKISDERHVLEIHRDDGSLDRMDCETRSYLVHDLLHYAVESEAGTNLGVWGSLSRGRTLTDLSTQGMESGPAEIATIERLVGALTGSVKGQSAADVAAAIQRYAESLSWPLPDWLTEAFVIGVQERMRQLLGHWKATPFGGSMDLNWPPPPAPVPWLVVWATPAPVPWLVMCVGRLVNGIDRLSSVSVLPWLVKRRTSKETRGVISRSSVRSGAPVAGAGRKALVATRRNVADRSRSQWDWPPRWTDLGAWSRLEPPLAMIEVEFFETSRSG